MQEILESSKQEILAEMDGNLADVISNYARAAGGNLDEKVKEAQVLLLPISLKYVEMKHGAEFVKGLRTLTPSSVTYEELKRRLNQYALKACTDNFEDLRQMEDFRVELIEGGFKNANHTYTNNDTGITYYVAGENIITTSDRHNIIAAIGLKQPVGELCKSYGHTSKSYAFEFRGVKGWWNEQKGTMEFDKNPEDLLRVLKAVLKL